MPTDRKRQTRLAFSPVPSSSPITKDYHSGLRDRVAVVTVDQSSRPSKRRRVHEGATENFTAARQTIISDDVELSSDTGPIRSSQRRHAAKASTSLEGARGITRGSRKGQPGNSMPSSSSMFTLQPTKDQDHSLAYSSDSSEDLAPADRLGIYPEETKQKYRASTRADRQQPISEQHEKEVVGGEGEDNDEDPDDIVIAPPSQRRKKRVGPLSSPVPSSPPIAQSDSEDEVVIVGRRSARRKSESEDVSEPKTPGRRKLVKRHRNITQQEKDDLAEDLDFLAPESDDESKVFTSTQSARNHAKQQALERLKRRRAGHGTIDSRLMDNDGHDGDEHLNETLGQSDDDPEIVSSHRLFQEDQDDMDFLVDEEDDEGPLGIPDGLPLAYTRFASEKPKNLFKFAVEWFVQNKINPAFERRDEIYDLTFRKLDDEIRGLAGSKFISSAWTQEFTTALNARPEVSVDSISGGLSLRDKCDACNRSGHPATFILRFQGKPYNFETLDELDGDEDRDDDSDDSSRNAENPADRDVLGREVAPVSTEFYVGKFCASNAQTAHALRHWKFHLNAWVELWLTSRGYCTAQALLDRDRWSTKKRRKHANKIVDRMEDEGVVKKLWRQFRNTSDSARSSKQGRFEAASP